MTEHKPLKYVKSDYVTAAKFYFGLS